MLTTENLVNLRNKDTNLQRVIKVSKLTGLTKSQDPQILDFIIHTSNEYDYHFKAESPDRYT